MTCQQCGAELISRTKQAKFCADCTNIRKREAVRDYQRRQRENKIPKENAKPCLLCGKPLVSKHYNAKYCAECKAERMRAASAKAMRARKAAKKDAGSGIREIAAKARSVGLSYGVYVVMKGAKQ